MTALVYPPAAIMTNYYGVMKRSGRNVGGIAAVFSLFFSLPARSYGTLVNSLANSCFGASS